MQACLKRQAFTWHEKRRGCIAFLYKGLGGTQLVYNVFSQCFCMLTHKKCLGYNSKSQLNEGISAGNRAKRVCELTCLRQKQSLGSQRK